MLRPARLDDVPLIRAIWLAPGNANWIEPPEEGEIEAAVEEGLAFLWEAGREPAGFAVLTLWVSQVFGLKAIATNRPGQGEPMMRALLAQVFGPLRGHRIGFDVTADNARALALYDRLGFRREGVLRECWQRPKGDWADCYLMGLLAREYQP